MGSGGEKIEARMCWTDEDFFNIFKGFKFTEGSPEFAFKNPDNIVLSEKTAKKIFGKQPALGKTLISDKYFNEVFTVGGVVHIPEQSHIDFGFIISEKNSHISGLPSLENLLLDKNNLFVLLSLDPRLTTLCLDLITSACLPGLSHLDNFALTNRLATVTQHLCIGGQMASLYSC